MISYMGLCSRSIINFSDLSTLDLELIGNKAFLLSQLKYLGIPIPDGFVIMPSFSQDLAFDINKSYKKLSGLFKETSLNIFTSPLKGKSLFFSDVKGDTNLILTIKKIWASEFNRPAAIVVQKNIKSKIKGKILSNDDSKNEQLKIIAKKIQKYFYFPQEIDYVVEKNKIFITQIKPLTNIYPAQKTMDNKKLRKVFAKGLGFIPGIATGSARILTNRNFIHIKSNEIIFIPELNASILPRVKKAKAIITASVLSYGYDKMMCRKFLQIPTIHSLKNVSKILHNGNIITVNGGNGEIYLGGIL